MTAEALTGEIVLPPIGGPRDVAVPETPLRDRIAAAWLLAQKRAHTEAAYRRDIEAFFAWCDEFDIDPLTARRVHMDGYRRYLDTGGAGRAYAPSTIGRKLSSISSFYAYAVQEFEDYVARNPMSNVERPETTDDTETAFLDLAELKRLLTAADRAGSHDAALVRMLFYSAVRVSELCSARTSDLRTVSGVLTLAVTRKGGRRDRVAIPAPAADALRVYLAGRTGGLFLVRGQPVDRHHVARVLTRLAKAAGIDKTLTPHGLRHTAATEALNAGEDIREVQRMLGHKRIETTLRYDRSRTVVDRSPAHALARVVEGIERSTP